MLGACTPQLSKSGALTGNGVGLEPRFSGLSQPTDLRFLPDSSGRALVSEQAGTVVLVGDGGDNAGADGESADSGSANGGGADHNSANGDSANSEHKTVLNLRGQVGCCGERGLLSLALHPNFSQNGLLFLYAVDKAGDTVLSRVVLDAETLEAAPDTLQVLLKVPQPGPTHNGGQLQFGPDGFLYLSTGDGLYRPSLLGALDNSQEKGNLLGKLLRLGVDEAGALSVPADNPFVGEEGARGEVWAYGLRNPWRFSFDSSTGELFVSDVGETAFEEVNVQPLRVSRGANYGWPRAEGPKCRQKDCNAFVPPALSYTHDNGCSVTGGYVYRGVALPELVGSYLYSDFCSGILWAAERETETWRTRVLLDTPAIVSGFAQDNRGEVFVLDYGAGTVYGLVVPD